MSFTYPHARPSVTVDNIVIGSDGQNPPSVLLIKRGRQGTPFYGCWALPGGFVDENEDLEVAARRELREETHIEVAGPIYQIGAFGTPGRDPRGHVISIAYLSYVPLSTPFHADDDAKEAKWWPLNALPELAFDHAKIIQEVKDQRFFA